MTQEINHPFRFFFLTVATHEKQDKHDERDVAYSTQLVHLIVVIVALAA